MEIMIYIIITHIIIHTEANIMANTLKNIKTLKIFSLMPLIFPLL
jgi:hypothetical protein